MITYTSTLHLDSTSRPRNGSGKVMPFATLTFLQSGTEEIIADYTADDAGVFETITLDLDAYNHRVQLKDQYGVLRYDVDPYLGSSTYIDAQCQALDDDGEIVPGQELLFSSDAAGLLLIDIFADPLLTIPRQNPILADSSGLYPPIYLPPGQYYGNGVPFNVAPVADGISAETNGIPPGTGFYTDALISTDDSAAGAVIGDPLPGHTLLVAQDIELGGLGFMIAFTDAGTAPAANLFASVTINGVTYLTADCAATGSLSYSADQTASLATPPANTFHFRAWFWLGVAGLVDGHDYPMVFT